MATTQTAAEQIIAQEQINNTILANSLKTFNRMQCVSTPGPKWLYQLDQPEVIFQLKDADRSVLGMRVFFNQVPLAYTPGTGGGGLNVEPLLALLQNLEVTLGNVIYQIPPAMIPIIMRTFAKFGRSYHTAGALAQQKNFNYSQLLYGTNNDGTTSRELSLTSGTNVWSGWCDIPMAWLQPINDALGVAPTLSGSPLTLKFATPQVLAGSDALIYPVYTTGDATVTLGTNAGGGTGTIEVFAYTLVGLTPAGSTPETPLGIVGQPAFSSGIEIRQRTIELNPGTSLEDYFVKFQSGTAQKEILKSIVILDNPGEVNGQLAVNENFTRADLMWDADSVAVGWNKANNPQSMGWIANKFIEQREMYGDLEPGILVYDFLSGTDPEYPNNFTAHLNLSQKPDAGVMLSYAGTINTGAVIRIVNMYGRQNLYTASPA
jgi:hypothetical protein